MQTYAEYRPTGFDRAGAFLDDDRQSWLVVPVMQTRDSGVLERANFEAAMEMLSGASETIEKHRFGHWGPGWYELILAHPSRSEEVHAIEDALDDYPVLDEELLSKYEIDVEDQCWELWGANDLQESIEAKFSEEIEATHDELYALMIKFDENGTQHSDEGPIFPVDNVVKKISRSDIEKYLINDEEGRDE